MSDENSEPSAAIDLSTLDIQTLVGVTIITLYPQIDDLRIVAQMPELDEEVLLLRSVIQKFQERGLSPMSPEDEQELRQDIDSVLAVFRIRLTQADLDNYRAAQTKPQE